MNDKIPLGLCWARDANGDWELVDVRDASHRPDDWFEPDEPKVEVFHMGWDCSAHAHEYERFVKAELIDPDGEPYRRGGQ